MDTDDTIKNALNTVLDELPKPVKDFVLSPERERIAGELSQKYNLHADQAGAFEQAFMLMLLGVSSPEEFVEALTKAGIPAESIRGLSADVNERVFVPLRKEEQEASPSAVRTEPAPANSAPPRATLPGSTEEVPMPIAKPVIAQSLPPHMPPPEMAGYPGMTPQMYGYIPQQMPPHMMYPPPYGMPPPGYGAPVYVWPQQPHMPQWPGAPAPPYQQTAMPAPAHQPVQTPVSVAPAQVVQQEPVVPQVQSPSARATLNPNGPLQQQYSADPYRESFT